MYFVLAALAIIAIAAAISFIAEMSFDSARRLGT